MPVRILGRCAVSLSFALVLVMGLVVIAGRTSALQLEATVGAPSRLQAGTDWTVGGPCGSTIQACIDSPLVVNGDRILIPAGHYTESLLLNKAVALIGDGRQTTVIHAVANDRVMTISGNAITSTVVVSGLTVTGGYLTGFPCPGACGAGILVTGTLQLFVQNCVITNNAVDFQGGGLYVATNVPITLSNVDVVSNTSNIGPGSGVYSLGPVTVINGRFEGNGRGSALVVNGALTISGTAFMNNTSGGGVRATGAVTVTGSRFERNHNDTSEYHGGGGLYVTGTLMLSDTTFVSNTAKTGGGGLAVRGSATIHGSRFEQNVSDYIGGALLHTHGPLSIQGTEFVSNVSEFYGGAVRAEAPLTVTSGTFENNWLGKTYGFGYGGAIWAHDSLTISGTQFISNAAPDAGGGIVHTSIFEGPVGDGRVVNALFARNRTGNRGSAMVLSSGGNVVVLHATLVDSGLNPGQAIVVTTGTVGITDTIITSHTVGISRTSGTVYADYNLFYGNTVNKAGAIGGGTHDQGGDPRFSDPAADDYHLAAGSAAIDKGIDAGVTTDIDGESRPYGIGFDIGADEYAGPIVFIYLPLVLKNR